MEPRFDFMKPASGVYKAMAGLEAHVHRLGIDPTLLNLIKLRASQINGCAYCIDMHSKDARAGGDTEQRLYGLSAWAETPFFTEKERAALAWTEAVTLIHREHVPDHAYQAARSIFSEEELANLTLAIVAINGWNRFAISFRAVPGNYQPPAK
jgi:AhpD family alkylhydroperoxidase